MFLFFFLFIILVVQESKRVFVFQNRFLGFYMKSVDMIWELGILLQKVWLDKGTGKACVLISSNGLAITGIDDRRYWSWISTEESR